LTHTDWAIDVLVPALINHYILLISKTLESSENFKFFSFPSLEVKSSVFHVCKIGERVKLNNQVLKVTYCFGFVTDATLFIIVVTFIIYFDFGFEFVRVDLKALVAFIAFSETFERIFPGRLHLLGLAAEQIFEFIVSFCYFTAPQGQGKAWYLTVGVT